MRQGVSKGKHQREVVRGRSSEGGRQREVVRGRSSEGGSRRRGREEGGEGGVSVKTKNPNQRFGKKVVITMLRKPEPMIFCTRAKRIINILKYDFKFHKFICRISLCTPFAVSDFRMRIS